MSNHLYKFLFTLVTQELWFSSDIIVIIQQETVTIGYPIGHIKIIGMAIMISRQAIEICSLYIILIIEYHKPCHI